LSEEGLRWVWMNNHDKIHNFNHKFSQMSCETCLCSEDWVNTNWREHRRRFLSLNWEQSADPVMEWKGDELIIQHLLNSFIKSSVRPREPIETYPAKLCGLNFTSRLQLNFLFHAPSFFKHTILFTTGVCCVLSQIPIYRVVQTTPGQWLIYLLGKLTSLNQWVPICSTAA
jgi:hypothetical protein